MLSYNKLGKYTFKLLGTNNKVLV